MKEAAMPRTRTITASLAALTAALAVVPAAGAQQAPAAPKLDVTGAYLYVDHIPGLKNQAYVKVVFRTAEPFARRYDGSIQGGAGIAGVNGSIASARKGAPIYTGASRIKDGKIASVGADGKVTHIAAKLGRSYKVTVFTRDGQKVTRTLKLRAERPGDDSGRPLVK
jgi:hypothetical protein